MVPAILDLQQDTDSFDAGWSVPGASWLLTPPLELLGLLEFLVFAS